MLLNDLFPEAEVLSETHYTDVTPKSFDDFRKRYLAQAKAGSIDDLYVQFTSKDNAMDRTAVQTPDHSDFVGTYAYPIAYILSHPADVWYGRGARYLRVLKSTAKKVFNFGSIQTEGTLYRKLAEIGIDYRLSGDVVWNIKKYYKDRIQNPNSLGKIFLQALQIDFSSEPTRSTSFGEEKVEFRVRTGIEQSNLLMRAGYDAVEDDARTDKQAIINSREPEQICFLNRGAFRVLEVVALRPGTSERKLQGMTISEPDAAVIERPFAQSIAAIMGDKLKDGPLRINMGGWSYYWTQGGRRIEIMSDRHSSYYQNKTMGQKKHRNAKLNDSYETKVVVHTELGDMNGHYDQKTKYKDIIKALTSYWDNLKASPVQTDWEPQDMAKYHQIQKDKERAFYRAQSERERNKRLQYLPTFLKDIEWVAEHYALPFKPNEDRDLNEFLIKACEQVSNMMARTKDRTIQDACQTERQFFGPKFKPLLPQWDEITAILEAMWVDLSHQENFWMVSRGGPSMFEGTRRMLKGLNHRDPVPDYEDAPAKTA